MERFSTIAGDDHTVSKSEYLLMNKNMEIAAVIMNENRHKNNFGFLVENDSQTIVDMAPLFDHNVSLLPYAVEDDFQDIDKYLIYKGPRIGNDWIPVAAACLDADLRKRLSSLFDFRFRRHAKYNLPEWRLTALENLIRRNIEKILQYRLDCI